VVSGYSNRVYERPVAGPYITFTDAINETTIMLKWMVRFVGAESSECTGSRCVGAAYPAYMQSFRLPHWGLSPAKRSWDPVALSSKGGLDLGHVQGGEVREPTKRFLSESSLVNGRLFSG